MTTKKNTALVREFDRQTDSCRSSVAERVLGKDEAESSILSDSTITRFWAKVAVQTITPENNPCWNWMGSIDRYGYGQFKAKSLMSPKRSHRIAWEICCGRVPSGIHVLHECDNPRCCNPLHMKLGTHNTNMADMKARNRAWKGGANRKVTS